MKEPDKIPSLASLDKDIRGLKEKVSPKAAESNQGAGVAMQAGIELVCSVGVGVAIGILLDRWLNTSPLFLLVFVLLGTAGGFLTLWRTVLATPRDETSTKEEDRPHD